MRNHARVLTAIWSNREFTALQVGAQRAYLLLLSQPDLTPCGALPYVPGRWARLSPDTPTEYLVADLEALAAARFILVDHETSELIIRTFVVHDGGLGNPKMRGAIKSALCALHSDQLRAEVVAVIPDAHQAEIVDAIADRLPIRLNAEVGGRRQVAAIVDRSTIETAEQRGLWPAPVPDIAPTEEVEPCEKIERAAAVVEWLRDRDRIGRTLPEMQPQEREAGAQLQNDRRTPGGTAGAVAGLGLDSDAEGTGT